MLKMKINRTLAISSTIERNPNAFRPKIASVKQNISAQMSLQGTPHRPAPQSEGQMHSKGCACKKSGCLKKYCECFQANIPCSKLCKCMSCKNIKGSQEKSPFQEDKDVFMDGGKPYVDPKITKLLFNDDTDVK